MRKLIDIHSCNCKLLTIDRLASRLAAADVAVAKATKASEISQIARIETTLRDFILAKWNLLSAAATKEAAHLARAGASADTIATTIRRTMSKWKNEVLPRFDLDVGRIYRLSRIASWRKVKTKKGSLSYDMTYTSEVTKAAELLPSMDLQDVKAIEALNRDHYFWIGNHFDYNVRDNIREVARKVMLEAGQDRAAAGREMSLRVKESLAYVDVPKGFHGTQRAYFEGLTANAATVARSYGNMRSFREGGITNYQINNPQDDRTCPVCSHMDGKVFTVEQGMAQMDNELAPARGDIKQHIKDAHPWYNLRELKEISPSSGAVKGAAGDADSRALSRAGVALPPFHFKCRCGVDISEEAGSWNMVAEPEVPAYVPTQTPAPIEAPQPIATTPAPQPPSIPGSVVPPTENKMLEDMATATLQRMERLGGDNANATYKAITTTDEGKKITGVWKPVSGEREELRQGIKAGSYYQREAAMYDIDRMMGDKTVVPPTVTREINANSGPGSYQQFAPAAKGYNQAAKSIPGAFTENAPLYTVPSARRMFLLDVIGANDDRHAGNVMYFLRDLTPNVALKDAVRLVAIDNGLALPTKPVLRFIFPGVASDKAALGKFMHLDVQSTRWVRKIDLSKLANRLAQYEKIEPEAIKGALVRTRALQLDPDILGKQTKVASTMQPSTHPRLGVQLFVQNSLENPRAILPKDEVEKIDALVRDIIAKRSSGIGK